MKHLRNVFTLCVALLMAAQVSATESTQCSPNVEANRRVVENFVELFYRQKKVREAFETYVAPEYIQHSPMAADGRDAAIQGLEAWLAKPDVRLEVHRIVVDGDIAVVHSRGLGTGAPPQGMAVFDMFRLKDGKIVEHWDALQPVPEHSANAHPMF